MTRRVGVVAALVALVLGAAATTARADGPSSNVSTNDSGVRVEIERRGPGSGGGTGDSGGARAARAARPRRAPARIRPAVTCRLVRVPASRGLAPRFAAGDGTRPLTPFSVLCNGRVTGVVWLDRSRSRRAATAAVREQIVRDVPLPLPAIRTSPSKRTMTGLETWFWVDGYDGRVITASVQALGATVEVEATPIAYHWDFGDGSERDGDLGRPAPERSSVTHSYDRTAPGGLGVRLTFEYAVRYRTGTGLWVTLPPVTRVATVQLPVVEVRGQLGPSCRPESRPGPPRS